MSKFKVGDRVRVKNVEVGSVDDGATFVDAMRCLCGLEGTISSVRPFYGVVNDIDFGDHGINGEWCFADEWLELVDEVSGVSEVSEVSERASEVESCGLDLVKLLKGCEGVSLWSPICGECTFKGIEPSVPYLIHVIPSVSDVPDDILSFSADGRYLVAYSRGECVLWPSRECQTWDGWVAPRWRAEKGGFYWFITSAFQVSSASDLRTEDDAALWEVGNYFANADLCKVALERLRDYWFTQKE